MPRRNPIHLGTPRIEQAYEAVESAPGHPHMELVVTYRYPLMVDFAYLPRPSAPLEGGKSGSGRKRGKPKQNNPLVHQPSNAAGNTIKTDGALT